MHKRATSWTVVLVGLVAVSTADASSLPGFVVARRTERATYYSRGASVPDVHRIEAYVSELEAKLGARAPKGHYYLYGSPQEVAAGTGHYTAGVTFPATGQIHTSLAFHRHEVVHLVAGGLGDPGRFFQEGLAVALGDSRKWRGKAVDAIARRVLGPSELSAIVDGFESMDAEVAYPLAGSFVAWLIDTQGMDKVAAFFRRGSGGAPGAFAATFGVELEEAGRQWRRSL